MNVYPFLLAIGSSVDNFVVGFALSISSKGKRCKHVGFTFNFFISIINALGACLSVLGGNMAFKSFGTDSGEKLASLLSGIAFTYLAYGELMSIRPTRKSTEGSNPTTDTSCMNAIKVSVPMTLNNVAGGVAGGAAGMSATLCFGMAFLASFCMMEMGHILGFFCKERMLMNKKFEKSQTESQDQTESFVSEKCHFLSAFIFAFLACSQLGNI